MAYLLAYKNGLDIIKADAWVKKHRSHRGVSSAMDAALESLHFPFGRDAVSAAAPDQEGDNEPMMDDVADAVHATDIIQNHFEMEASDNIIVDDIDNESIGSYGSLLDELEEEQGV